MANAASGDTIQIDAAGNYSGDVCTISQSNLTLQGVNGRPVIDAAGQSSQGKAIWVITGNNTTVDNIEFTGATVVDQNGAGIRQEGQNLTVRHCYFHHNDDGILTADNPNSAILIEYSEFGFNGFGDGQSHNIYISHVGRFTLQFSYSHDSVIGHLVKSRAAENYILYNRLTSENGTTSYELDLPSGGKSYVIGNLIEQGQNGQNSNLLAYMEEGSNPANPSSELYIVNNTFVNDLGRGQFLFIGSADTVPALVVNNIFTGPGNLVSQTSATLVSNLVGDGQFVNRSAYDYRLTSGSPAIDVGTDPGTGSGVPLLPTYHYVHPVCGEARNQVGTIDVGAYEFGSSGSPSACGSGSGSGSTTYSLAATPANVNTGSSIVVSWTAPAGSSNLDWIALFRTGSSNQGYLWWEYTGGSSAGSFTVPAPTQGTYEFRYLVNDTFTDVIRSNTITVAGAQTQTYALSATPSSVNAGSPVAVSWTAPAGSSSLDWIGLFPTGSSNLEYVWRQYTSGSSAGNFTVPAPSTPGTYEFRYLVNDSYTDVIRSNSVVVVTASQPQPQTYTLVATPTSAALGAPLTVFWTAPAGSSSLDWIALYAVGSSNFEYICWQYTGGASSGSLTVPGPNGPGTYEFRYLVDYSFTDMIRSNTVTVQ